ncbi:MAG: cytochrome c biogenesis protein [Chlorobi bacterium]|nr:cytochrome c biogenesis protein [Chlorobiota bacterium]
MKYLYYALALCIGFGVGFGPGIYNSNKLRAFLSWLLIAMGITLALYPPVAGTFQDVISEKIAGAGGGAWVLIPVGGISTQSDSIMLARDIAGKQVQIVYAGNAKAIMAKSITNKLLLKTESISHSFFSVKDYTVAPHITLPHIPALGEKARILFFHVPCAWIGFFAYLVTMIFSIRYLLSKNTIDDILAVSSATIGTLFTALAYISGAIWAKFNWGHFFNWDTRELSVLLLLAIYTAYFVLRNNVHASSAKRIAAVYAIVAATTAVFLVFIVPRITFSLHPGSRDDTNIGPLLTPEQDALDATKAAVFSLMLAGFTLLYTWLLNIVSRYIRLTERFSAENP